MSHFVLMCFTYKKHNEVNKVSLPKRYESVSDSVVHINFTTGKKRTSSTGLGLVPYSKFSFPPPFFSPRNNMGKWLDIYIDRNMLFHFQLIRSTGYVLRRTNSLRKGCVLGIFGRSSHVVPNIGIRCLLMWTHPFFTPAVEFGLGAAVLVAQVEGWDFVSGAHFCA